MQINGFLGIDKPAGWTSHDVVGWVRKHTGIKKVGHTGTLDPMATGVMVVCLGAYTRLSAFVSDREKRYRAVVRLGAVTDTLDADGQVKRRYATLPEPSEVMRVISSFSGEIEQIPPMYSAIRTGGKRLYELARKGKEIARPARSVKIFRIDVIAYCTPLLHLDIQCSKGTYIRTLADDIGHRLGCGGHLCTLQRTAVGAVVLSDCIRLRMCTGVANVAPVTISPQRVLSNLVEVSLKEEHCVKFCHGNSVPATRDAIADLALVRVTNCQGSLLGIGQKAGGVLKPFRVMPHS